MQTIAREASPRRRYFRGSPSLRPWLALALLLTGCNQLERIDTGGGAGTELPADVVLAFERSCGTSRRATPRAVNRRRSTRRSAAR